MEIAGIPLHDVILVLAGLAGVYFAVMLLRIAQISRRRHAVEVVLPDEAPAADAGEQAADDEDDEDDEFVPYAPQPAVAAPAPAPQPAEPPSFGAELARSRLETEVRQLRDEIEALRTELAEIKTARLVSPQYADAMAMAQRGLTARDLADRCGISLGEAELVWALSRGAKNFEEGDEYGGEPGHRH